MTRADRVLSTPRDDSSQAVLAIDGWLSILRDIFLIATSLFCAAAAGYLIGGLQ